MKDRAMSVETEENEATETVEIEEQDDVQQESQETEAAQEVTGEAPAADDELVVTIGDGEQPPAEDAADSPVLRTVRQKLRETQRKLRELEARAVPAQEQLPVVGKKPTLEDHDYDTDAFENALMTWHSQKRKVEEHAQKQQQAQQAQQAEWENRLQGYTQAKKALKVRDFDDAEAVAQETFNVTQQGIILQGAANPALLVYALGKNAAKAKELAAITDPVKFTFAVARLETELKTAPRKPAVAPEQTTKPTARVSGAVDDRLNVLREKAEKSGDYSAYLAYKRSKAK
jgi:hypothetical protein